MIRASPCDYYLRYLVTHPDNYEDRQIRNLVKLQHLDFVGMKHLEHIRKMCLPPNPFYPEQLTHHPSRRFLEKHRIFSLWHYSQDADAECAIKLLDHPRGKELTEQMLFTGCEPLWVSMQLKRVNFAATPRAIELYRHYYYNTELVSGIELRAIMGMRSEVDINDTDSDERSFRENYRYVSKSETANLTTNSALSPFSRIISMLRVGLMPTGVQISRIATAGRTAAVVRSLENSLMGRAEPARDFALTAKILNELLESVGDVSGDLQRNLMSVALDTDASEVPSIESLTEGNHTVDLLPEAVRAEVLANAEEDDDE
jgi:hypothetical protein